VPDAPAPAPKRDELPQLLPGVSKPAESGGAGPEKESDDEYKEQTEAMKKADTALKDAKTAADVAMASACAIEAADALLERVELAQLHQDVAQHDYQGKVGDTLDASPEHKAEGKRLSGGRAAVVSALSLKARALIDQLSADVPGAADEALRLCVRPTSWAEGSTERERGFVACLRELAAWGDTSCEAGAIAVRWALWQSKLGLASKLLREAVGKSEVDDSDYVELQRALPALLGTWLGFEHFGEMLATKAALGSPATRRPF
jgi:hypothetical protein